MQNHTKLKLLIFVKYEVDSIDKIIRSLTYNNKGLMDHSPLPKINLQKQQNIIYKNDKSDKDTDDIVLCGKKKQLRKEIFVVDVNLLDQFFKCFEQSQVNINLEEQAAKTQFIRQYISPLNSKHVDTFTQQIRNSLLARLAQRIQHKKINFTDCLNIFAHLMKNFKDCSVTPPIIIATYVQFENLWFESKKFIQFGIIQQQLFRKWKLMPYQKLDQFLNRFQLLQQYQYSSISDFLFFLTRILFENKVQQVCYYYLIFKENRKSSEDDKKLLETFEYQQLLPRITKKDQLFTEYVLTLLKRDEQVSSKVFDCIKPNQSEKLINLTRGDINKHPKVLNTVMKKHYRDILRRFPEWYIVEDKISFNSKFVEWFAASIIKNFQKQNESDSEAEQSKIQIQTREEAERIAQSLLYRAGIIDNLMHQQIKNPLYEKDDFVPAEFILQQCKKKENFRKQNYFQIEDPNRIKLISQIDSEFYKAKQTILNCTHVGFDSQFRAIATKYQQTGVSIIQLATSEDYFIFDYHKLRHYKQFNDFLITLMEEEKIIKIGHTVSSDLQSLYQNFQKKMSIKNMVDLTHLLKRYYPQQAFSSLAFMAEKFLNKKMCKYQQRSNWNRRPLKKTQLYYAALDAYFCLLIYQKIKAEIKDLGLEKQMISENIYNSSETSKFQGIANKEEVRASQGEFDFVKFHEYLKNPIFLIDNMLKKLCTNMRNLGIDAEYIAIKDYDFAVTQAKRQKRIIVTRDSKLLLKRYSNIPIYLLKQKSDSDLMFAELKRVFNINLEDYQTLSRCVKCNNSQLIVITAEEARKQINFTHEDNIINEFWRCTKCRQIYWEGGQFQKAKLKYQALRK